MADHDESHTHHRATYSGFVKLVFISSAAVAIVLAWARVIMVMGAFRQSWWEYMARPGTGMGAERIVPVFDSVK